MPPWVARQCHVLRGLKPASVRVCRRPHVSLRPYTQAPTGDDGNLKIRSANSAIIIPRSVVGTTPEDLIQHITPIGKGRLKYNRCAVFLVTPSFAPWLLDDSAFIQKAIHHTYSECLGPADPRYARVYALCAVVDKLPAPKPIHPAEDLGNEAASRSNQPPIGESGFEGMAYATLRYADWIASSFEPPDDQALISFVASTTSESVGYFADTLRLPLANTIFQTGSPSTMIDSLWVKNKGGQEFALKRKRSAKHHSIKIHAFAPGTRQASSLAVPLIPLTVPRRVEASMGNILRRVTGPDGESALASQELEQVVPQFYNARRESSQATMVWALVISKEKLKPILAATDSALGRLPDDIATGSMMTDAELWDSLWKKRPAAWNDLVPNALVAGARLHRVLSGGGGWGKKAGLLSLDPVASAPDTNSSASDMSDGPDNLSSALQQVARDGDYIQFFISPSNNIDDSVDPLQQLQEAAGLGSKWSWELGTIPSTVDALPAGSWQHNSSTTKETFVFRNCFGALTEGGVSINRNFELRRKEASPPIGGSKIDVPFSRFSSASLGPEGDIHDEDSIHEYLKKQPIPYHPVLIKTLYGKKAPPLLGLSRFEESEDERDDQVKESNVRPQHTGSLAEERVSGVANRRISDLNLKTAIYRPTLVSKTDNLPSPIAKEADEQEKCESTPFRIRLMTTDANVNDYIAYHAAKLRNSILTVQDLTSEARHLMNAIRRSRNEDLNPFTQPRQDIQDAPPSSEIVPEGKTRLPADYIATLDQITDAEDANLYALQKEARSILEATTQNVINLVDARTDEFASDILLWQLHIADILRSIDFRATLPRSVNEAAVDVYTSHIHLRWCLAAMILSRQRHAYPSPLSRGIVALERKFVALRGFAEDLFFHGNGGRFVRGADGGVVFRRERIRDALARMERANAVLSRVRVSEPARRGRKGRVLRGGRLGDGNEKEMEWWGERVRERIRERIGEKVGFRVRRIRFYNSAKAEAKARAKSASLPPLPTVRFLQMSERKAKRFEVGRVSTDYIVRVRQLREERDREETRKWVEERKRVKQEDLVGSVRAW